MVVCISTDVLSEFREFERASVTALNAFLVPLMDRYLSSLVHMLEDQQGLGLRPGTPVMVMEAAGGVMTVGSARDKPVLTMFAGSYLAPLLPMTRSTTWEIRRGAITSLARLSDDHLRAAVAALRSFKGRSVLVDIMEYCSSQLVDAVARREAVEGLVNLLGHTHAQSELRAEGLLPALRARAKKAMSNARY